MWKNTYLKEMAQNPVVHYFHMYYFNSIANAHAQLYEHPVFNDCKPPIKLPPTFRDRFKGRKSHCSLFIRSEQVKKIRLSVKVMIILTAVSC